MIEETGYVVGMGRGQISVLIERNTACGSCSAQKGCGQGVLAKAFSRKPFIVQIQTDADFSEGDGVVVGVPEKALVTSALVVYAMPLLLMLAFAGLAVNLFDSAGNGADLWALIGGVTGLATGLIGARLFSQQKQNISRLSPQVIRRYIRLKPSAPQVES